MNTYVVRVWLADRPGMLGQVTTTIGAIGGDVIAIEILEQGGGQAVDELMVSLPAETPLDQLLAALAQVPGVGIEDARAVPADRPDPSVVALDIAARLVELDTDKLLDGFARELIELYDGAWATVADLTTGASLVELGSGPDLSWLTAFLAGSAHLDAEGVAAHGPSDMAWARLDPVGLAVAIGRQAPFRARERRQLTALSRIASSLLSGPMA